MESRKEFRLEYVPYSKNLHDARVVRGVFRVTLDSKFIPDSSGKDYHSPGYLFSLERLLSCSRSISENEIFHLSFSDGGFEILSFTPSSQAVAIRSYDGITTEIPKKDAITEILDCYRECCKDNGIEIDKEDVDNIGSLI